MNHDDNPPAKTTPTVRGKIKEKTAKLTPEQKRKLRQELAQKSRQKKSEPVQPTKQRHKLVDKSAVDLSTLSGEDLRRSVGDVAQALYDQFEQIRDRQGANREAWVRMMGADEDDPVAVRMKEIDGAIKDAMEVIMDASNTEASERELTTLAASLTRIRDVTKLRIEALLTEVEGILRADLPGGGQQIGDPMQVLDGLEELCDPARWQEAVGQAIALDGHVRGNEIPTITKLIQRYYDKWDKLGTDGLKGAKYGKLKELADVRMDIVTTIAESNDPLLMACCRPSTPFYLKMVKLASQDCEDRDVQTLVSWWASHSS